MIENHQDGRFVCAWKKSAPAVDQDNCEHRDKHLMAHLIPISLIMTERQAAAWPAMPAKAMKAGDFGSECR
jgi:hypothetical protein